jgi:hypothetical protein
MQQQQPVEEPPPAAQAAAPTAAAAASVDPAPGAGSTPPVLELQSMMVQQDGKQYRLKVTLEETGP